MVCTWPVASGCEGHGDTKGEAHDGDDQDGEENDGADPASSD